MADEATDYDELLKSVFHSCDKDGKGFLSSLEFQELCEQLCLEVSFLLLQLFNAHSFNLALSACN